MMNRRHFLAISSAAALTGCASMRPEGLYGRLIVLRHADRTFSPLNEAGVARAAMLPEALADLPIDAIWCT
ncbi:MAG: hypothetical protein P8X51_03350, partial [Maritimibacter sp.]